MEIGVGGPNLQLRLFSPATTPAMRQKCYGPIPAKFATLSRRPELRRWRTPPPTGRSPPARWAPAPSGRRRPSASRTPRLEPDPAAQPFATTVRSTSRFRFKQINIKRQLAPVRNAFHRGAAEKAPLRGGHLCLGGGA